MKQIADRKICGAGVSGAISTTTKNIMLKRAAAIV